MDFAALQAAFEDAVESALRRAGPGSPTYKSDCATTVASGPQGKSGGSANSSASALDPYIHPHSADEYYYKLCTELRVRTRPTAEQLQRHAARAAAPSAIPRVPFAASQAGTDTWLTGRSRVSTARAQQTFAAAKLQEIVLRLQWLKGKL